MAKSGISRQWLPEEKSFWVSTEAPLQLSAYVCPLFPCLNLYPIRSLSLPEPSLAAPTTKCRRDIFPRHVRLYVHNDAVAALACGTMGKLHGCVLIAGTGNTAYGFTEDGRDARAAGAGPILGDWGRPVGRPWFFPIWCKCAAVLLHAYAHNPTA